MVLDGKQVLTSACCLPASLPSLTPRRDTVPEGGATYRHLASPRGHCTPIRLWRKQSTEETGSSWHEPSAGSRGVGGGWTQRLQRPGQGPLRHDVHRGHVKRGLQACSAGWRSEQGDSVVPCPSLPPSSLHLPPVRTEDAGCGCEHCALGPLLGQTPVSFRLEIRPGMALLSCEPGSSQAWLPGAGSQDAGGRQSCSPLTWVSRAEAGCSDWAGLVVVPGLGFSRWAFPP